ncbi:hypothetical protein B0H13DRAFT_2036510, partial [Mycena leptocephala]
MRMGTGREGRTTMRRASCRCECLPSALFSFYFSSSFLFLSLLSAWMGLLPILSATTGWISATIGRCAYVATAHQRIDYMGVSSSS